MSTPTLFWFRRDLRIADQPALAAAAAEGPVVGVFVIDPALWGPAGANRRAFLARSLEALDRSMHGSLVVVDGPPAKALAELADSCGAGTVHATEDFGPYGRQRDDEVRSVLARRGVDLRLVDSPYAVPPGSITTGSGTPYKVFTPFFRSWKAHGWADPLPEIPVEWLELDGPWAPPDQPPVAVQLPPAGEAGAWAAAERFLDTGVDGYAASRDLPGIEGTSRLSPYLKWGVLHPRQLLAHLDDSPGAEAFRSELCWREFYAQVLYERPDSARHAYVSRMAAMELDEGEEADRRFEAWANGRTGYPIVDAGMRQLVAEGWMHNRVRMIVASFLVKDLHIDWTRGARFFMDHLVDGDLASNSHGWQWVAGTGTDASPYFRIFNPVSQSKKFDGEGRYLRRWIPEIAHLPDRSIHAPWTERTGAPAGYPPPVVDHDVERRESLDRYERIRRDWA